MCEPSTIAIAAIAGTQIAGTVLRANAEKQAADATAAIYEANAVTAEKAQTDAVLRGQVSAGRARLEAGRVVGRQTTGYAAAGVDPQGGSALDVLSDTAGLSELDVKTIENNAAREAWGYKTQAADFRRRAAQARAGGDARMLGTVLGGIGSTAAAIYPMLSVGGGSGGAGFEPTPMSGDWAGAYAGENY